MQCPLSLSQTETMTLNNTKGMTPMHTKKLLCNIEHATDLTCRSCTQGALEKQRKTVKNTVAPIHLQIRQHIWEEKKY